MVVVKNNGSQPDCLQKTVEVPIGLYESLRGRYFTAQSPVLTVTGHSNAWSALYNPKNSGVNLRVNVATLNYIYGEPLTIGIYMNADLPGEPRRSSMIAPANTAFFPLPEPEVRLLYASDVCGKPSGGEFSFSRTAYPGQFMSIDGGGVFAVPPGGNYCVFLRSLECKQKESRVYVAFGWWEEPVSC